MCRDFIHRAFPGLIISPGIPVSPGSKLINNKNHISLALALQVFLGVCGEAAPSCLGWSQAPPLCCLQILVVKQLVCPQPSVFSGLRNESCTFQRQQTRARISRSNSPEQWLPSVPHACFLNSVKLVPRGCLVSWAVFFQVFLVPLVTRASSDPAQELPRHTQRSPISSGGLLC